MRVSAWCSRRPYLDHLAPIWGRLDDVASDYLQVGSVYVIDHLHEYARSSGFCPRRFADFERDEEDDDVFVIFSRAEFPALPRGVPAVFIEHGAGASYHGQSHLVGGGKRYAPPIAAVCTTPAQEAAHREVFAGRVHVVGCPKLDRWRGYRHARSDPPVVAFSHHWDQHQCAETRSAWPWDKAAWERLVAGGRYTILGHKHPGDSRDIERWCRMQHIEFVPSFDEVLRRADVYVADNSSTLYEFAATGRPVVCLSPPWYRRDVHHGVRFWEHVPGVECALPDHLKACITEALADVPARRALRERAVRAVYGPLDGLATERVLAVLRHLSLTETFADLPRPTSNAPPARAGAHGPTYRRSTEVR